MELTDSLRVEQRGAVLRAVLDRPDKHNSIDGALLASLHGLLDRAERASDVRLVTIEATGPVFCSGMDFASATSADTDDLAQRGGAEFFGLLKRFTEIARVIVSIVDGRATGGGVGLVAASDFVYATERASFGLPEALWGLLPCCVLPFLIRRVGFQPAYAMTLSTLPIAAGPAQRVNLVDEVVDSAEPALRRLTARLTKLDGPTIGDAKRYFGQLEPLEDREQIAVTEFARLLSAPAVRQRLADFAQNQQLPWEKR
jgi:polyketide biosynthesis enoyl-CoA hydratase PksH